MKLKAVYCCDCVYGYCVKVWCWNESCHCSPTVKCIAPIVADLTAGGCSNDKPVWQMDKNVITSSLESAYDEKVASRSRPYYSSSTCLQNRKAALVGFKDFTYTPNNRSEFYTLLLYEDDNLSIVLKWALEKLAIKPPKATYHTYTSPFLREDRTKDRKW